MVSSIVPGSASGIPAPEPRLQRSAPAPQQKQQGNGVSDRVDVSAAGLGAARESVREGLMQIHHALALGHDAQAMLVKIQALTRNGPEAQAEVSEVLSSFVDRLETALAQGAHLAGGQGLEIQAEPASAPLSIAGVDLRPGKGVIGVDVDARADDPGLPTAVQRSLEALQDAMGRLLDSARALEAHLGFLNTASGVSTSVRHDLDADGARLLALQIRQGLEGAGSVPIANAEPQSVLSLFRA